MPTNRCGAHPTAGGAAPPMRVNAIRCSLMSVLDRCESLVSPLECGADDRTPAVEGAWQGRPEGDWEICATHATLSPGGITPSGDA